MKQIGSRNLSLGTYTEQQALRVPEPPVQSTVTRLIKCSQTLMKQHIREHQETPWQDGDPQAAEGFYNSAINT